MFLGQIKVYAAFVSFVEQHPESRSVLDDLWRHLLVHHMTNIVSDEPSKIITPPDLNALINYVTQPFPTKEEIAINMHSHIQLSLQEFRGF